MGEESKGSETNATKVELYLTVENSEDMSADPKYTLAKVFEQLARHPMPSRHTESGAL